jgi:hypothetical protein
LHFLPATLFFLTIFITAFRQLGAGNLLLLLPQMGIDSIYLGQEIAKLHQVFWGAPQVVRHQVEIVAGLKFEFAVFFFSLAKLFQKAPIATGGGHGTFFTALIKAPFLNFSDLLVFISVALMLKPLHFIFRLLVTKFMNRGPPAPSRSINEVAKTPPINPLA